MHTNKFEKDILVSMVVYGTQADEIKEVIDFMNLENLNLSYNFLIIDNLGSTELSAFCKTIQNKNIEYLYPGNNVGFGSGHNIAAKHYSSIHHRTHLILNPDVYISDECIRKIYSFINADENISIVSPKLHNEDGSVQNICRLLPSVGSLIKRFINKIFSINRANIEDKFNLVKKPIEVPSMHGAFSLC
jgi:GT2 family glycosyltransferase